MTNIQVVLDNGSVATITGVASRFEARLGLALREAMLGEDVTQLFVRGGLAYIYRKGLDVWQCAPVETLPHYAEAAHLAESNTWIEKTSGRQLPARLRGVTDEPLAALDESYWMYALAVRDIYPEISALFWVGDAQHPRVLVEVRGAGAVVTTYQDLLDTYPKARAIAKIYKSGRYLRGLSLQRAIRALEAEQMALPF